jgi:hypothetical protein
LSKADLERVLEERTKDTDYVYGGILSGSNLYTLLHQTRSVWKSTQEDCNARNIPCFILPLSMWTDGASPYALRNPYLQ